MESRVSIRSGVSDDLSPVKWCDVHTVRFVDDYYLVFQADIERFSRVLLQ